MSNQYNDAPALSGGNTDNAPGLSKLWSRRHRYDQMKLDDLIAQLSPSQQVTFACDCAERVLNIYEDVYPNDPRPRAAILAARQWAIGQDIRRVAGRAAQAARSASGPVAICVARAACCSARTIHWGYPDAVLAAAWAARAADDPATERNWQRARAVEILSTET